jgi:bifunctional DNA-binding transcriptional regulator/antitoxin component of YhaV-PrlF toxin-antitoxin module
MSKSTDERGRLYLPKDVRERFGEEYRVVELPDYVALFPVADDPIAAVEEAVGDELEGKRVDELQREARRRGHNEIAREWDEHDAKQEEER